MVLILVQFFLGSLSWSCFGPSFGLSLDLNDVCVVVASGGGFRWMGVVSAVFKDSTSANQLKDIFKVHTGNFR